MNERRWNGHLWAGFLLCLLGFASYTFVFAKFPITRDVLRWSSGDRNAGALRPPIVAIQLDPQKE